MQVVAKTRRSGRSVGRPGGGASRDGPGKGGGDPGMALRNRLGFTLWSTVHRMRGVRVGGV